MSRQVMTEDTKTKLQRVLNLTVAHHFKSLPVVDNDNRLRGYYRCEDVIRALARCNRHQALSLLAPALGYYAIA
jgi:Mg/Co/Ni transporter MgtE